MIFDHIVLSVKNHKKSKEFYLNVLEALGIKFIREEDACIGFGTNGKPSLWLCNDDIVQTPMHIAFVAQDRKSVDAFHAAALAAGGKDNGGPGLRKNYQPNYYAAFVIDPDGHNIEAVCRSKPE